MFWNEKTPEGFSKFQGIRHVFEHHLVFLAALDGTLSDNTTERTVFWLASVRQVLVGPYKVISRICGIRDKEPPANAKHDHFGYFNLSKQFHNAQKSTQYQFSNQGI